MTKKKTSIASVVLGILLMGSVAYLFMNSASAGPIIEQGVEKIVVLESFDYGGTNARGVITWDADGSEYEHGGTARFSFGFAPRGLINVTKIQVDITMRHEYNDSSWVWLGFNNPSNPNITQCLYHEYPIGKVDMCPEAANYIFSSNDTGVCSSINFGINTLRLTQYTPNVGYIVGHWGGFKMFIFRVALHIEYNYFRS